MKKIYNVEMKWDLDTLNIKEYQDKISKIIEKIDSPSILLLWFDKVTYINSTAIWTIADWYNKLEDLGWEVILLWVDDTIMDTLDLVWLGDMLSFYDNIEEFKLEHKDN